MRVSVVPGILIFPCNNDGGARGLTVLFQSHVKTEQVFRFLEKKIISLILLQQNEHILIAEDTTQNFKWKNLEYRFVK